MKNLFYKPIKETGKNHEILFWGCLHWHHNPAWENPIWARRGFTSVEQHDAEIIRNWNNKANSETVGFLLGDNLFGKNGHEEFPRLLNQLAFKRLYIMSGNHHAGWKHLFDSCEENVYTTQNGSTVIFIPNYVEAYINGQAVVMCHYPVLSWNGAGHGAWMLFSHVHGSLQNSELGRLYLEKGGFVKEVSVEVCPSPMTYGEISAEMRNKPKFETDHHDENASTPFS